ncbi:MAG: hypothetical protein GTO22_02890 [Gemmatimonadales bacterium]|nr:hypothetical protein [Gemmatimonadales bacterium]
MARWGVGALVVLVVVGIGAIPASRSQGQDRGIGYVSTEIILRQTPGYAEAESTFNAEMASWRAEVEQLQQTLDSAMRAFDQQSIVLSPTARQEKMDELQRLQQQYTQRANQLTERANQRQRELMAPLEERIQLVIDGLRAERNLSLIFDVSAPGSNIISADPVLDLTTVVVRRLTGEGGS